MTTITAALINSEFGTSVSVADLEVIINSSIDTVNSDAHISIGYLSGSPGTITVTGDQAAAIKPLIASKLASRTASGASSSSVNIGSVSKSQSVSSSINDVNAELYIKAIQKLIGKDFKRA